MNKKLKKIILNPKSTIRQSMQLIQNNGFRGSIVTDKKKTFLGTLTDGDLRKFILKNNNLNKTIEKIYNRNCTRTLGAWVQDFSNRRYCKILNKNWYTG